MGFLASWLLVGSGLTEGGGGLGGGGERGDAGGAGGHYQQIKERKEGGVRILS